MLALRDVSFAYPGGPSILDGFSIDLQENEIVSLLGPSGCGKSTVLRIVADLLEPDAGTVDWREEQNLAFVFQDHALMPWSSVEDNVALPGRLKGAIDQAAITSAIEAVGLDGLGARFPAALSGGQRMRASVARALAARPSLLLMDEPFAALDEILRFQMNELLLDLRADRGFGVLFVTHSLYEAAYLSDRVVVMGKGRVEGGVTPKLDRALTAEQQRTSPEFLSAVQEIGALMAGEKP